MSADTSAIRCRRSLLRRVCRPALPSCARLREGRRCARHADAFHHDIDDFPTFAGPAQAPLDLDRVALRTGDPAADQCAAVRLQGVFPGRDKTTPCFSGLWPEPYIFVRFREVGEIRQFQMTAVRSSAAILLGAFEIRQSSVTPDLFQRMRHVIQMSSLILHGR